MKKLLLLALTATYLFSFDFLVGFGYGTFKAETEYLGSTYKSSEAKNLHYKVGLDLETHRILVTQDAPNMASNQDLSVTALSWHAIDQTDPYIRGFFGLSLADFAYKNSTRSIDDSQNAYGVELGVMLLEEGAYLQYMEMEFGMRYFITNGLSQEGSFKLNDFSSMYVGFNFLF